jgi:SPW repeat
MSKMSITHWQDPLNLILGIWMIVSPWALQYQTDMQQLTLNAVLSNAAVANAVILGILIAAAALIALFRVMAWEEWVNVVLGVWLVISPWVLGFSSLATAMWNAVIIGIVVAVLALWALGTDKDIGGWWSHAT